ncbi:hypothetical protein D3C87_1928120 [compost metagenome]
MPAVTPMRLPFKSGRSLMSLLAVRTKIRKSSKPYAALKSTCFSRSMVGVRSFMTRSYLPALSPSTKFLNRSATNSTRATPMRLATSFATSTSYPAG